MLSDFLKLAEMAKARSKSVAPILGQARKAMMSEPRFLERYGLSMSDFEGYLWLPFAGGPLDHRWRWRLILPVDAGYLRFYFGTKGIALIEQNQPAIYIPKEQLRWIRHNHYDGRFIMVGFKGASRKFSTMRMKTGEPASAINISKALSKIVMKGKVP